ncbi:hypothetical protein F511_44400 [Dorcoceras hygrometricum]|uniref:Uncharacterized protein n=1 Tax=Dorcoceras hygrometricum TaxID=472368 RepID=A0A2Z6ZY19_9LAMI|nr:hypothetical protein F511_44400 [Dorcoceras hygrometricum]
MEVEGEEVRHVIVERRFHAAETGGVAFGPPRITKRHFSLSYLLLDKLVTSIWALGF